MSEEILREIGDAICDLMIAWGPDGHIDGHQVLSTFAYRLWRGDTAAGAKAIAEAFIEAREPWRTARPTR